MNFYPDAFMWEEITMAALPVLTSVVPSSLLGIASYVLTSLALYTLATRRGIDKAWLSWVPVLNVWIIGSLSDQYRYVAKGQYKSKRKALLILNLVNVVITVILLIVAAGVAVELVSGAVYGVGGTDLLHSVLGSTLGAAGLALTMSGIAIAAAVIRYMAMYDIYTSMDPGNSVMFLVLSIIFHVTEPFFLFFSRNKDAGMPPRRKESRYQPQEPVCESWEDHGDDQ